MNNSTTIHNLLRSNKGIVFGDDHPNPAISGYLANQMAVFEKAGVKTLFIEMFQNNSEQNEWLEAFNTHQDAPYLIKMKEWLKTTCDYPPRTVNDYMAMFESARKHHIELVGINLSHHSSLHHIRTSNAAWEKTIKLYLEQPKIRSDPDFKYAVFCGKSHTHIANNELDGEWDQTTGIDRMLDLPCVTFAAVRATGRLSQAKLVPRDGSTNTYLVLLPQQQQSFAATGNINPSASPLKSPSGYLQ